ncbi:MAG: hypothetical protein AAGG44_19795, partial [Planctomycetota bacterium]
VAFRTVRTITEVSLRTFDGVYLGEPQRLISQSASFDYSLLAHNWHYYAAVFSAASFLILVRRDLVTSLLTLSVAVTTCLVGLSSFAIVSTISETPVVALGSSEFDWTAPAIITVCGVLFFLSAERLIAVIFCPISAGHIGGKGNPLAAAWNAVLQLGQTKPTEYNWWKLESRLPTTANAWPAYVTVALCLAQLGCGIGFAIQKTQTTAEYMPLPDAAGPFLNSLVETEASPHLDTPRKAILLADQQLLETYIGHTLKPTYCDEVLVFAGHHTATQVTSLLATRGLKLDPVHVDSDSIEPNQPDLDSDEIELAASANESGADRTAESLASSFYAHHTLDDSEQSPITVCWIRTWYAPQSQTVLASSQSDFIRILEPSLGVEKL